MRLGADRRGSVLMDVLEYAAAQVWRSLLVRNVLGQGDDHLVKGEELVATDRARGEVALEAAALGVIQGAERVCGDIGAWR